MINLIFTLFQIKMYHLTLIIGALHTYAINRVCLICKHISLSSIFVKHSLTVEGSTSHSGPQRDKISPFFFLETKGTKIFIKYFYRFGIIQVLSFGSLMSLRQITHGNFFLFLTFTTNYKVFGITNTDHTRKTENFIIGKSHEKTQNQNT